MFPRARTRSRRGTRSSARRHRPSRSVRRNRRSSRSPSNPLRQAPIDSGSPLIWLHRFATFVAASTVLLIAAGGMVTSTDSGLAVPDWPNTYGQFMFSYPYEKWVGGIFYEHGHRLIAST